MPYIDNITHSLKDSYENEDDISSHYLLRSVDVEKEKQCTQGDS